MNSTLVELLARDGTPGTRHDGARKFGQMAPLNLANDSFVPGGEVEGHHCCNECSEAGDECHDSGDVFAQPSSPQNRCEQADVGKREYQWDGKSVVQ